MVSQPFELTEKRKETFLNEPRGPLETDYERTEFKNDIYISERENDHSDIEMQKSVHEVQEKTYTELTPHVREKNTSQTNIKTSYDEDHSKIDFYSAVFKELFEM